MCDTWNNYIYLLFVKTDAINGSGLTTCSDALSAGNAFVMVVYNCVRGPFMIRSSGVLSDLNHLVYFFVMDLKGDIKQDDK